jgi:transposase
MPGYADCFSDLWENRLALVIARQTGSAAAVRAAGLDGLRRIVKTHDPKQRCSPLSLTKILAWAEQAAPGHAQADFLRPILVALDDDRQRKMQEIRDVERASATLLAKLPYVLLLVLPGINVVSAAELGAELGPMSNYPTANNITGRAGLMPSRYQSDLVDCNGPLQRRGNRRIRAALMQIADNLVVCNHYFRACTEAWRKAGKDPRWIRVKLSKRFSRIAFAMVGRRCLFNHPACQQRHYILDKLLAFHREHDTPVSQRT